MDKAALVELARASKDPSDAIEMEAAIRHCLESQISIDDRKFLMQLLAGKIGERAELQRIETLRLCESTLTQLVDLDPSDPNSLISLSSHYYYFTNEHVKALTTGLDATRKAEDAGHHVRHAYLHLVRVAITLGKYDLVTSAIQKLVQYKPPAGSVDVSLESDILGRLPKDAIDAELLHAYEEQLRRTRQ